MNDNFPKSMRETLIATKVWCDKLVLKLAVAESLTGGNIQAAYTSIPGASTFFAGGVTTYNIDQKVNLLQVERTHAEEVNCVSAQVAVHMALGVKSMFDVDCAIATTGYAEKWDIHKPHAYVCIIDSRDCLHQLRVDAPTGLDRVGVQELVTREAVSLLWDVLQQEN